MNMPMSLVRNQCRRHVPNCRVLFVLRLTTTNRMKQMANLR